MKRAYMTWICTGLLVFSGGMVSADVALPGSGGGGQNDSNPPPSPPPPTLPGPQTGIIIDELFSNLELVAPGVAASLGEQFSALETRAGTIDEWGDGYRIGEGEALRERLLALYRDTAALRDEAVGAAGEQQAEVDELFDEFLMQLWRSQRIIEQADTAVHNGNLFWGVDVSLKHLSQLRRYNTAMHRSAPLAGSLVEDLELVLELSYASFDDRVAGGSGHERELSFMVNGSLGDHWEFGLGASRNRYRIGGPLDLLRRTSGLDLYTNYAITDWLAVGAFMNYAETDIEDSTYVDPLLGPLDLGDTFGRWAGGLSASAVRQIGNSELGLTTSLASIDKQSLERLLSHHDTASATMLDLYTGWNQWLGTTIYGTYVAMLDHGRDVDGSFWMVGADVSVSPNDRVSISIGYETTLAYKDYHENRLNASISFAW